jgi:DNA-binding MarR family transcriptional regulator
MSARLMCLIWDNRNLKLNGTETHILIAIADSGYVHYGPSGLSKKTKYPAWLVKETIEKLIQKNILYREDHDVKINEEKFI